MAGIRNYFLATGTLCQRELVRFLRQRSRVIGALAPPILFWFLIGSGLGSSFRAMGLPEFTAEGAFSGGNYLQYFFPGTIALIVLFTAIFSTISVIEDRHEGFLQSVLVAPLPRGSLVFGNIAGGTLLAFGQGFIFLCFAPMAGISFHPRAFLFLLLILLVLSFGLTGLGFFLAWQLDSSQGFHAIMNLFLIPMWLLSGALFPIAGASRWLRAVMRFNPLTYGVSAMQSSFLVQGHPLAPPLISPVGCLAITAAFGALTFALSVAAARRRV